MQIIQSRRDFLPACPLAGAARVFGARTSLADEGPPETTTIRLATVTNICIAPTYIAAELLRAEGFTDVRYVPAQGGFTAAQMIGRRRDRLRHDLGQRRSWRAWMPGHRSQ